jgi:hypothetical protein
VIQMAKRQRGKKAAIQEAAEAAGRTVGFVANSIDALQARHPDPMAEVHAALATAAEKIGTLAAAAHAQSDAAVRRARAAIERAQQLAGQVRQTTKTATKRLTAAVRPDTTTPSTGVPYSKTPVRTTRKPQPSAVVGQGAGHRESAKLAARGRTAAGMDALAAANVKRRQAHVSSQTKRRQARRDKKG